MHRPLSRPLTSSVARAVGEGGVASFSVSSLFAAGEQGGIYDISDLSTLFSDAAGTTPATVDGVVGKVLDKSGRGNHRTQSTTASKPILRSSGGRYWLEYDGVDDFMVTAAVNFGVAQVTIFAAVRKVSDAARGVVCELGPSTFSNAGTFHVMAPWTDATNSYGFIARGAGSESGYRADGHVAPLTSVLSCGFDLSQASRALETMARVNGTAVAATAVGAAEAGAGPFGNFALYFGRRAGTSLPFSGREYYTVIRGAASTAAQISSTEAIAAQKCGVTL